MSYSYSEKDLFRLGSQDRWISEKDNLNTMKIFNNIFTFLCFKRRFKYIRKQISNCR